jgi:hypothetical protein
VAVACECTGNVADICKCIYIYTQYRYVGGGGTVHVRVMFVYHLA